MQAAGGQDVCSLTQREAVVRAHGYSALNLLTQTLTLK